MNRVNREQTLHIYPDGRRCRMHPDIPLGQRIVHLDTGEIYPITNQSDNRVYYPIYCFFETRKISENVQLVIHNHLYDETGQSRESRSHPGAICHSCKFWNHHD